MSLRWWAGLLVAGGVLLVPVTSALLLRWFPPPDLHLNLELCSADTPPGQACIPPPPERSAVPGERGPARMPPPGPPGMFRFDGPQGGPLRNHFLLINLISAGLMVCIAVVTVSWMLRRPLRALLAAIGDIERGAVPPAWAFSGPAEMRRIGNALGRLGSQLRVNLQERDLMLAGLSHDLRSPLARIQAALELRSVNGERWDDTLRDVADIDHIVGQFVDFARDGRDEPLSSLSLDQVVRSAVRTSSDSGPELDLQVPDVLRLRSNALRRAVANLIDNAVAHGAPPYVLRTRLDRGEACIRVEDAGPGIAPADYERLLQPFARGQVERRDRGAGLGLAIVERVARMHDGTLAMCPRTATTPFALELRFPAVRAEL